MVATPKPPPEAVLIARARKAVGVSTAQAAAAARERAPGIRLSSQWWSSIELGYERKTDGPRAVSGQDHIIAHMARVVGISPDRLEDEGQRPEAAEILREMLRSDSAEVMAAVKRQWGSLDNAPRHVQAIVRTPRLPDEDKLDLIDSYLGDLGENPGTGTDIARRRRA